MKRKYRITVEGKTYEVEVEDMGIQTGGSPVYSAPDVNTAYTPSPPSSVARVSGPGAGEVLAPAPGKILSVSVNPGDPVRAGDELLVLESMKIETRIEAPLPGTVKEVRVKAGDTVKTRDLMVMIQPA